MNSGVDEDGEGCIGMVVVRGHSKREKGELRMEMENGGVSRVRVLWVEAEKRKEEEVKWGGMRVTCLVHNGRLVLGFLLYFSFLYLKKQAFGDRKSVV